MAAGVQQRLGGQNAGVGVSQNGSGSMAGAMWKLVPEGAPDMTAQHWNTYLVSIIMTLVIPKFDDTRVSADVLLVWVWAQRARPAEPFLLRNL